MKVATLVALVALIAIGSPTAAQQDTTHGMAVRTVARTQGKGGTKKKAKKENLSALAKISKDSASKVALARVPGGRVKSSELEREKGTVVYSFDITAPGKTGVEEVLVSAIDGSVVSQEHETPKQERAEMAKEKKEAKKP